jgi:hypothetical protein
MAEYEKKSARYYPNTAVIFFGAAEVTMTFSTARKTITVSLSPQK